MTNDKKTIFSGIQPSGNLHIGNYLGAIYQWVEMQKDYDCIFCVVDYHAITVPQDPKILKKRIIEIAKIYLASGLDPKNAIIFQQSDVKEHVELGWILNTISRMSDLFRMTQFKDKSGIQSGFEDVKEDEKISVAEIKQFINNLNKVGVGLFDYPVLMAADILLYNTDIVPVGGDQSQHVELARDIARRFNNQFGETFKVPEVKLKKESAFVMGLDNPLKKMSKSAASPANYVALLDDPKAAAKKIMRAVTDSGSGIVYDKENKPAIANLLNIFSLLSGRKIADLEKAYEGKGYGDFKKDLAETVGGFLENFQKKYNSFSDDEVRKILDEGADKARVMAEKKMREVKEKIGVK